MKKTVFGFIFTVLALCAICFGAYNLGEFLCSKALITQVAAESKRPCYVIDPGHGGIDSGAVGINNILEKDINLSVAKKLTALLKLTGADCEITRDTDSMLVADDVKSHRKMQDLKNRAAFANSKDNPIFVSIHMNKFSDSRYSGLQVWYSKNNELSRSIASTIQGYAKTYIDCQNDRQIKAATSQIYLLDRLKMPAVLVECGFLSNSAECEKLSTDSYQTQLAVVLLCALLQCETV